MCCSTHLLGRRRSPGPGTATMVYCRTRSTRIAYEAATDLREVLDHVIEFSRLSSYPTRSRRGLCVAA